MGRPVFGVTLAGLTLTLLITCTLFLAFNVQPARSSPATIIVPDDYPTIQTAIDNALAGDTIFVSAGTYNCNIRIDKPLTLRGESNQNTTLRLQRGELSAEYPLVGLHVTASNVTISGFQLISPVGDDDVILIMVDGRGGVADNCVIMDNVLEEYGTDAIVLMDSQGDVVVGNVIFSQDGSCIDLLSSCSNCLLGNNSLSGSEFVGIYLDRSSNNTISGNFITNQIDSMGLHYGAITLGTFSDDNTVIGNMLVNNDYGVTCWHYTQSNLIYHNNFVNNTHQTYDQLSEQWPANFWDNGYPSGGNYWSDYHGNDSFSGFYQNVTGSDGIGDAPYVVDAVSSDRYPLMIPWKNPVEDLNLDGKVDITDVAMVSAAFGSYPGHPRWRVAADINDDGKVDVIDVAMVAGHFGEYYT